MCGAIKSHPSYICCHLKHPVHYKLKDGSNKKKMCSEALWFWGFRTYLSCFTSLHSIRWNHSFSSCTGKSVRAQVFCVFLAAPNRHYQTSITDEFPGKNMRPWSKMGVLKRSAFVGMTPFKTALLLYLTHQRTVIHDSFFTDFQICIIKQTNSRKAWKIET